MDGTAKLAAPRRARTGADRAGPRWLRRSAALLLAVGTVALVSCDPPGSTTASSLSTLTMPRGCGTEACAEVDTTRPTRDFGAKASGLLGTDIFPADMNLLESLRVSWWRLSTFGLPTGPNPPDYRAFDQARAQGARIIEILSDDWWQQVSPANGGAVPDPSADWAAWDAFVRAKVRRSMADGRAPDFWEVWNEPGGDVPPVRGGPLDVQTQLALYEHTWRAIKAVDPSAKVAYPAATAFSAVTRPEQRLLGLPQLLDFVRRRALTLDALTYHENASTLPASAAGGLVDRAAAARSWLDARGMRTTKIVIDEYLPPQMFGVPAANLAYLSAVERSAADGGARACWQRRWPLGHRPWPLDLWRRSTGLDAATGYSGCNLGQLDNLADLGGHHPMAAWWVQHLYSDLKGRLVPVRSPASLPALATVAGGGTTVVLVGQSRTCTGDVWATANPRCPPTAVSAPPVTATIRVRLPHAGVWKLADLPVPNTPDPVDALSPSHQPSTVTTDESGVASVQLSIADGEVHQLTFARS